MQSVSQASIGVSNKPKGFLKNGRGKENLLSPQNCLPQGTQKQTLQKIVLKDPQKSKLPVPSKTKAPPDFLKMHQAWQNDFQRGKAVSKKSCTRPQPFNFTKKEHRSKDVGLSVNCKDVDLKENSEVEFKADPAALLSILSNTGVPTSVTTGKLSLAQRVPMRVSTAMQQSSNARNMMVRSSMYTMRSSQTASTNFGRMSFLSKMPAKDNDQKLSRHIENLKRQIPDASLVSESATSKKDDKLHSQENPVLQQMNQSHTGLNSGGTSLPKTKKETNTLPLVPENTENRSSPAVKPQKCSLEVKASVEKIDPVSKTLDRLNSGAGSGDFVADSQALNSILTNTGVTVGNCGKLSLAQRVPVQGDVVVKSGMTFPVPTTVQATTPKPIYGRISNMAVPLKEIVFSPCRVPNSNDQSSGGSARRVHMPHGSSMKFSQARSGSLKNPIFPKTPRALALEKANKCLEDEPSDPRTATKSTVKWLDELSPSLVSEVVCENEPDMEQVAVRLFSDGDCPGDEDKNKESAKASDSLKVLDKVTAQLKVQAVPPDKSDADGATPGDTEDIALHMKLHPAPLSQLNTSVPPMPLSSVSCVTSSLPLSFLSHPAVKDLPPQSLGPLSLPRIAQLRLQATVSSKQKFWDTYLDEECAFYTSRGLTSSCRSICDDPVSSFLHRREDMHFTPILPGDL